MAHKIAALSTFGFDNIKEAHSLTRELRQLDRQLRLLEASTAGIIVLK